MRRFTCPVAVGILVASMLAGVGGAAQPIGRLSGAARLAGRRTGSRPSGFHVMYAWQERQGPILVRYEVHAYRNGFLRYARFVGLGQPSEYTPPSDRRFVEALKKALVKAKEGGVAPAPCGAPRGGVLLVEGLGAKRLRLLLDRPEQWQRYGRVARSLVRKVMNIGHIPLEADCRPLVLKMTPGPKPVAEVRPNRNSDEMRFLALYGRAKTDEAKLKALSELARIRNGDPFFRFELLRRYPTSDQVQTLLTHHLPVLVRQVRDPAEAGFLLQRVGNRPGAEFDYHRAVLHAARFDLEKSSASMVAFHKAMGQDKQAIREAAWFSRVQQAKRVSRSDKTTWRQSRMAYARLFDFYRRMGLGVWSGPPDHAPPLALHFLRRAVHFARLSVFSRGPAVGGKTATNARQLVLTLYPILVKGSWLRHPVWHRFDLLALTGYLRRNPRLYRTTGLAGPESVEKTLRHMVRLRRYKESENFVSKYGKGDPKTEAGLRLVHGRALVEMEQWKAAGETLTKAAQLGSVEAVAELVNALVEEGDLTLAALKLHQSSAYAQSWQMRLARARLMRRYGQWAVAAAQAKAAAASGAGAEAQRAWGLTLAAQGRLREAVGRFRAAFADARFGCAARADAASVYLAVGKNDEAKKTALRMAATAGCRAATAHALLAVAFQRQGQKELAGLVANRARFHAAADPDSLVKVARVLVSNRVQPPLTERMLRYAIGLRPGWSVPHALLATVLAEGGNTRAALLHARAALKRRPHDRDYRALYRAILKVSAGP